MLLDAYLRREKLTELQLARRAGIHSATVNRARNEARPLGIGLALKIEQATNGEVRAEELQLSATAREALRLMRESPAA